MAVQWFCMLHVEYAGFSGYGRSVYNKIPQHKEINAMVIIGENEISDFSQILDKAICFSFIDYAPGKGYGSFCSSLDWQTKQLG